MCPPRRPDRNGFVERDHRTYDRECLRVHRPATEGAARAVTAAFVRHDNDERPNQPPRVAYPILPARPPLPRQVDPDGWLRLVDGQCYVRKVRRNGTVTIEGDNDYIDQRLAGQYMTLQVRADVKALVVHHRQRELKRLPHKGLQGGPLSLEDYVAVMQQQARSWRQAMRRAARDAARAA